jgi:hypothetical protein
MVRKRRGVVESETIVAGVRSLTVKLDPIGAPPIEDEIQETEESTEEPATISVPAGEVKRVARRTKAQLLVTRRWAPLAPISCMLGVREKSMPRVTVPIAMSALQRTRLVADVTTAFDTKMRCGTHGKMLTRASLVGDVLMCDVCCEHVVPDAQKALAILIRRAANAS